MQDYFKLHAISFAQTFVASFLSALGTAILAIPQETMWNPHLWSFAFIGALIISAARTAVKIAYDSTFPNSPSSAKYQAAMENPNL